MAANHLPTRDFSQAFFYIVNAQQAVASDLTRLRLCVRSEKKFGSLSRDEIRKSMDIDEEDEELLDDVITAEDSVVLIEGKTYKVEKKPEKL